MTSIFKMGSAGMHNDFTLFSRKVPSGKSVVYSWRGFNTQGLASRGSLGAVIWKAVWESGFMRCIANKVAALTGMRCCEVLGLRGEFVFDDHLFKGGQYDKYGYRETKTKIKHHIPLAPEIVEDLWKLVRVNGDGYLFSMGGGVKPVTGNVFCGGPPEKQKQGFRY